MTKRNYNKLHVYFSKKHFYINLKNINNNLIFNFTTNSNKSINMSKNLISFYIISLKIKLFFIKFNLENPLIYCNKKSLNGSLKLLYEILFNQ